MKLWYSLYLGLFLVHFLSLHIRFSWSSRMYVVHMTAMVFIFIAVHKTDLLQSYGFDNRKTKIFAIGLSNFFSPHPPINGGGGEAHAWPINKTEKAKRQFPNFRTVAVYIVATSPFVFFIKSIQGKTLCPDITATLWKSIASEIKWRRRRKKRTKLDDIDDESMLYQTLRFAYIRKDVSFIVCAAQNTYSTYSLRLNEVFVFEVKTIAIRSM